MKNYLGSKLIKAKPMTRLDYKNYRGWKLPSDENGADSGYLVEYIDGGHSNHPGHKGYVSWSPEPVFNNAYREIYGLSFGEAINALKIGKKVARTGWNGKGMWLMLAQGSKGTLAQIEADSCYHRAGLTEVCVDPHIDMFTAQGTMQPGWLASQADMLSDDWEIVE